MRNCLIVLGTLLGLGLIGSSAQASKGVKKTTGAEQHIRGTVVAVHHNKNGHGSITIKTHQHKKKTQVAAATRGGGKSHTKTYTVSKNTQFSVDHGQTHKTAGFRAVHKGEQVSIAHKGQHADKVSIHSGAHNKKTSLKKQA
jgi:hypothetical protein